MDEYTALQKAILKMEELCEKFMPRNEWAGTEIYEHTIKIIIECDEKQKKLLGANHELQ